MVIRHEEKPLTALSEEKIVEFLMDIRDRVDAVELLKSQHEDTHEVSFYKGQLAELNRIIENSKLFFNMDVFDLNYAHKMLDSYELSLQDASGKGFQAKVKAFDVEHAQHKAALDYPDYSFVEARKI
ncbi:hypothetical protein [Paenibacillus sp. FSL H7-0331]|jgi:hypothetical protein|uniref:hypothetical protein n=1 Tax=Paenibacillus sp. FSL H7-0331 TaxID=1920421 RepID=UPI00096C044A|nr:hypothetical protein [Paenibacillus sp. FSL H7-0331]OMF14831.1 hypothetical protein BK127_16600 [Paenibacillus sp. FSL H7-0331]